MQLTHSDTGKTSGPLPDRRTSNHMKNPGFKGTSKVIQDVFFFYIRGAPYRNLHNKCFHQSSAVFTSQGPRTGGFPDVCSLSLEYATWNLVDITWGNALLCNGTKIITWTTRCRNLFFIKNESQKSTLSNLWTDDHAGWFLLYQLYTILLFNYFLSPLTHGS